jgi:ABC-type antimicrobial peptide transport system permease subunit
VFFIIAGALMGGIAMAFPLTFLSGINESGYDLTWIVFGHIVGVNSPIIANIIAGFMIQFLTATRIGIVAGVFLYKTNILNISKPSNGLRYGLLVGVIVYLVFAIPVEQFVLNQEFRRAGASEYQITPLGSAITLYCDAILSAQFFVLPTVETVCRQTGGYGTGIAAAEFVPQLPKKGLI